MPASQLHQQQQELGNDLKRHGWVQRVGQDRGSAERSVSSNKPSSCLHQSQTKQKALHKKKKKKSCLLTLRDSAEDMWRNDQCFRTHGTQPRATNLPILCLSVCLPGLLIVVAHGHKTLLAPPVELRPPSSAQIGSGVAGFVARFIASPDGCVTAL